MQQARHAARTSACHRAQTMTWCWLSSSTDEGKQGVCTMSEDHLSQPSAARRCALLVDDFNDAYSLCRVLVIMPADAMRLENLASLLEIKKQLRPWVAAGAQVFLVLTHADKVRSEDMPKLLDMLLWPSAGSAGEP